MEFPDEKRLANCYGKCRSILLTAGFILLIMLLVTFGQNGSDQLTIGYKQWDSRLSASDVIPFPMSVLDKRHSFNYDKGDVMVHLHIPKTGGSTFGRHLLSVGRYTTQGHNNRQVFQKMPKGWLFAR